MGSKSVLRRSTSAANAKYPAPIARNKGPAVDSLGMRFTAPRMTWPTPAAAANAPARMRSDRSRGGSSNRLPPPRDPEVPRGNDQDNPEDRVREVALSQPDRFVIGGPRGRVEDEEVNPRNDEHNDQDPSNQRERHGP